MRVLHLPFTYFPDAIGGTEVYVRELADGLSTLGIESVIAAPGRVSAEYVVDETRVTRFVAIPASITEQYSGISALKSFADQLLERDAPDVVHFHSFTPPVAVPLFQRFQARQIPMVATYHTPTVSCSRGTLMLFGRRPCDGKILPVRCAECTLDGQGVPRCVAKVVSRFPPGAAAVAARSCSGRLRTALLLPGLLRSRNKSCVEFLGGMRFVVALSRWTRSVLELNEVRPERIVEIPHHVRSVGPAQGPSHENDSGPLRLVFVGRLSEEKGLALIRRALDRAQEANLRLDIFGIDQNGRRPSLEDPRVRWLEPLPRALLIERLRHYHALVVPSQCLETGPLVVLEALSVGVPVIGSKLGGIAEKLIDGVNGFLLPHDDPRCWGEMLLRLAFDHSILARLDVRPREAALAGGVDAMADIYQRSISESSSLDGSRSTY